MLILFQFGIELVLSNSSYKPIKQIIIMSRIDLINQYGRNQEQKMVAEKNKKVERINCAVEAIKRLAPRMKEIYEVAVACVNNGIALAERNESNDTRANCFITNGWSHYVGLLGDIDYSSGKQELYGGFGKCGGGAFDWGLKVDLEGNITELKGRTIEGRLYVLEAFVKGWDEFETNFYKYVDNVVGNVS